MTGINDESHPGSGPEGEHDREKQARGYLEPHEHHPELPPAVPAVVNPPGEQGGQSARIFLLSILLILLMGSAALFIMARWETETSTPSNDLVEASARSAGTVDLLFETQNSDQAARFVRDRFGRRIATPVIEDALLVGVGSAEVSSGIRVPAYLYREADGGPITVFAYNYATLDQHEYELRLERSIFHNIVDPEYREVRDLGKERAVIWRNRDDIFLAVMRNATENVRRRILSY